MLLPRTIIPQNWYHRVGRHMIGSCGINSPEHLLTSVAHRPVRPSPSVPRACVETVRVRSTRRVLLRRASSHHPVTVYSPRAASCADPASDAPRIGSSSNRGGRLVVATRVRDVNF